MALDDNKLKEDLKKALSLNKTESDPDKAIDKQANAILSAIKSYLRSAEVKFDPGKVTGGTPANGSLVGGKASGGKIL